MIITDAAKEHIQSHISVRENGYGIKLYTKTTGCSGLAYVIEYFDRTKKTECPPEAHEVSHINDVIVVIPIKDKCILNNITIDYGKNGLNEGLKFINPAETGRCGCGESFKV